MNAVMDKDINVLSPDPVQSLGTIPLICLLFLLQIENAYYNYCIINVNKYFFYKLNKFA